MSLISIEKAADGSAVFPMVNAKIGHDNIYYNLCDFLLYGVNLNGRMVSLVNRCQFI